MLIIGRRYSLKTKKMEAILVHTHEKALKMQTSTLIKMVYFRQ